MAAKVTVFANQLAQRELSFKPEYNVAVPVFEIAYLIYVYLYLGSSAAAQWAAAKYSPFVHAGGAPVAGITELEDCFWQ